MIFEVRYYDKFGWFEESSHEKFESAGDAMEHAVKEKMFITIIRDANSPIQERIASVDIVV